MLETMLWYTDNNRHVDSVADNNRHVDSVADNNGWVVASLDYYNDYYFIIPKSLL